MNSCALAFSLPPFDDGFVASSIFNVDNDDDDDDERSRSGSELGGWGRFSSGNGNLLLDLLSCFDRF